MTDLINRQRAINAAISADMENHNHVLSEKRARVIESHLRIIAAVDAEPVRHGKWIPHEDEDGEHYGDNCSECGEWYVMPYGKTNYCPHCGADMKGNEDD